MEVVGGPHGVNDDIGERTGIEALHLDMIAESRQITIERTQLAAAAVVIGELRGRNRHFDLRVGPV